MAGITRKSLTEHINQAKQKIKGAFNGDLPLLGKVTAEIQGHNGYTYEAIATALEKELHPETASISNLLLMGARNQLYPKVATFAKGNCIVTGTAGTLIAKDTLINISGNEYKTTKDTSINGATEIEVQAVNAGIDANQSKDETASLQNAITGVDASIKVATGGITGGAEEENLEIDFRQRVTSHFGGNSSTAGLTGSYADLAKQSHAEITRAWEVYKTGRVYVLVDGNPTKVSAAAITKAEEYIKEESPPFGVIEVRAPETKAINKTIEIKPNDQAQQTKVLDAIKEHITESQKPGETYLISEMNKVIAAVTGMQAHRVTNSSDVTAHALEITECGTITFKDYV